MADNLPPEVIIAVPRAFQDYVTRRQSNRYLVAIAGTGLLAAGYWFVFRVKSFVPVDIWVLYALGNAAAWSVTLKKAWQYKISADSINVFWLKPQWGDMLQYELKWKRTMVLDLQEERMAGPSGPSLSGTTAQRKEAADLWMVYAHEDVDTVQNVVLPLIETYRQQYRHPLWADTLRQEKP